VFKGKEGMQEVKGGPSIGHRPFFCWSKRLPINDLLQLKFVEDQVCFSLLEGILIKCEITFILEIGDVQGS
jgi:hypothetical protein